MPYRLIAEWAVTSGMRRMELCALTMDQVPRSDRLHMEDHPLGGNPAHRHAEPGGLGLGQFQEMGEAPFRLEALIGKK